MTTLEKFKELLKIKNEKVYYRSFFKDFETFNANGKIKAKFTFDNHNFNIYIYPLHFELSPDTIKNEMIEEVIEHISKQKDLIEVFDFIEKNDIPPSILKNFLFRAVLHNKQLKVLQRIEKLNVKYNIKDIFLNAFWEEYIQDHVKRKYRSFPFNDLTSEEIKVLKGLRKVL